MSPTINRSLAVVTGASSGIGLALAKEFARNGFDLVVIAENNRILTAAEELRELVSEPSRKFLIPAK